jgi:DNA-binding helix-hairpin-helix protein with protein kinase domain
MPILFSSGEILRISRSPLGVGGEGKVYRVANDGRKGLVAKIYNQIPSLERQQKLKSMVTLGAPNLGDVCAWPIELLTDSKSNVICGFTMIEVEESEPIHHYYSPSWRKQNQPNASWDNMLQLAKNLAAAFDAVHKSGIVVGDINPNSVRVKSSGRVMLIDSDSFQITNGRSLYKCRVGVPSFTAPELLGANISFDTITRSTNHDLFGLSLLIFHILFMGRHPFAGVFAAAGDTPLESHIRDFRYTYASDNTHRGLSPPPLSIHPRSVAGQHLVAAFENDFTQIGAVKGRIQAGKWFEIISGQRMSLARCSRNSNHVHDSRLSNCIWCEMDRKGLVLFNATNKIDLGVTYSASKLKPEDLLPTDAEKRIIKQILVFDLNDFVIPQVDTTGIMPRLPLTAKAKQSILRRSLIRMSACLSVFGVLIHLQGLGLPLALLVLALAFLYSPAEIRYLFNQYNSEVVAAKKEVAFKKNDIQSLISEAKKFAHSENVEAAWHLLANLKRQYDKEESDLLLKANASAKQEYLSRFLLCDAGIRGVGASRTATLAAFGIETAADLSPESLSRISGIGPVLMTRLLDWKKSLLQRYTPPSTVLLEQSERHKLLLRYISLKQQHLAALEKAVDNKIAHAKAISAKFTKYKSLYVNAVRHEASVSADIRLLRSSASRVYGSRYIWLPF